MKKLSYETRHSPRALAEQHTNRWTDTAAAIFTPKRCQIIACMFFAFMLVLGAIPGEAQALSDAFGDKLLHLFAYSFLSLVLFGGLSGSVASRAWRTLLMIGLLGAVDETLQGFMSYRNASLEDWLFDLLAAGGTLTVLIFLSKRRNQKYQRLPHRVVRPAERPH